MHRRLFLLAVTSLMIFATTFATVDLMSPESGVGRAFGSSGEALNLQDQTATKLKSNQRCLSARRAECQRAGEENKAPEAEFKVSAQKITLPCKEGETDQTCTPSDSQQVQLQTNATDTDGDTLSFTYSTTGGTIKGEGPEAKWDLTGARPGAYTATVEVDDACGCVTFSTVKVEVARCPDCK